MHPTPASKSRRSAAGPVITILLLAPIVAEALYGALRASIFFVLIPEIMTWGCGALLIRECIRRWGKSWPSTLLMGLAIAAAEELVIQQTSLAPLVGLAPHEYGRAWGVNWIYLLWALAYEAIWVVVIPIQLTELLFPALRDRLWLRMRGMLVAGGVFLFGAFVAWYSWTQRARAMIFHMPAYSPPAGYLAGGAGLIALLILAAYLWPGRTLQVERSASPPWLAAAMACALGTPWAAFVLLGYGFAPAIPPLAVFAAAVCWAVFACVLFGRWTSSPGWSDPHRHASVLGGVLACTLGGFVVFQVTGATLVDWIGKAILDAAAILWLLWLGGRVRSRAA